MPSGMMPLPVGVSVAMMKRSNASSCIASRPHNSVVRRLPAVHTCSAMVLSLMTRSKSRSGIGVVPHRHGIVSGLRRAEAGFRQPDARAREFDKIVLLEAGFEDHGACDH